MRAAQLPHRWRRETERLGHKITLIAVAAAFETGLDGFWLARWLGVQQIDVQ